MDIDNHNFYKKIMQESADHIMDLFEGCETSVHDLIGHDSIDTEHDLHVLTTYIQKHGSCCERVWAMISSAEWVQAYNYLRATSVAAK